MKSKEQLSIKWSIDGKATFGSITIDEKSHEEN